jgi:adenylate cyclase
MPDISSAALDAATQAFATLDLLNAGRVMEGKRAIRFGLALHVGEVTYGNIGGSNRLDFTCIGQAVNLAARLESLAGRLGRDLVVSAEFAQHTGRAMVPVGEFELKGVPGLVAAFAPV